MFVLFRLESKIFCLLIYKQEKHFTKKTAKKNQSIFGKYILTINIQN